jgi:hypothetical protein
MGGHPTSRLMLFGGIIALLACGGEPTVAPAVTPEDPPPPPPRVVSTVQVTIDSARLAVGSSTRVRAVALDQHGGAFGDSVARWSLEGTLDVATVSDSGLVNALASGLATLVATVAGVRGTVTLDVYNPAAPPDSVVLTLDSSRVYVGSVTRARAHVLDARGVKIPGKVPVWTLVSGAEVASMSDSGVITTIAPGSATIAATADSIASTAVVTILDPALIGADIKTAEEPREILEFPYPTVTGRQILVRAGENLQAAFDTAARGDEIVVQAGATFTGNFVLPPKPGTAANGWIIVRSDQLAQLPPLLHRVTPYYAPLMPRIVTPNSAPAITVQPTASGWRLVGLDVSVDTLWRQLQYGIVALGDPGRQTAMEHVPSDIVLDRMFVHGQPMTNTTRCVALNSARSAVIDSFLWDCHAKGFDSQAIVGWNGPGPFKIVNNTLAGAGENIMFGGADPAIPGLIPSDIEIRRNHIVTPIAWKGVWTRKNLFELKNARRVLLEGNVLEGSWADAQAGYAMILKSSNQAGRCTWCSTSDVTIRNNLFRNVGAGINFAGREGTNKNPVDSLLRRVTFEHNIMLDVAIPPYSGEGRLIQLIENVSDVIIRHSTFVSAGTINSFVSLAKDSAANGVILEAVIATRGTYGIFASGRGEGLNALFALTGSLRLRNVAAIGAPKPSYPIGVTFVGSWDEARLRPGLGADEARVQAATKDVVSVIP